MRIAYEPWESLNIFHFHFELLAKYDYEKQIGSKRNMIKYKVAQ